MSLILRYHNSKIYNANVFNQNVSRFVIAYLKKNKGSKNKLQQLKNIVYKILVLLLMQRDRHIGIGFGFSGRVYGARKAAALRILLGSVPFNTLNANIDYSSITQKTRNGT